MLISFKYLARKQRERERDNIFSSHLRADQQQQEAFLIDVYAPGCSTPHHVLSCGLRYPSTQHDGDVCTAAAHSHAKPSGQREYHHS